MKLALQTINNRRKSKMKNKLSKLYKIFLAVGMVFSMCFNTLGMSVVNAYDPSVPKEFTRVKNIK